jgi:hypothetical protein
VRALTKADVNSVPLRRLLTSFEAARAAAVGEIA